MGGETYASRLTRAARLWDFMPLAQTCMLPYLQPTTEVPLFSCYVFVRCALNSADRTRVYRVESIHGFVGTHGTGMSIPDEQIESIRTVLSQPAPCRSHPFLKVGQRVRVCGGAMDGVEGVFLSENGDQSLVISVEVIQRSLAVRIDGYEVKPI